MDVGYYKCPSCGSEEIIWDSTRGDIICSHCGLVIEEKLPTISSISVKSDDSHYERSSPIEPVQLELAKKRLRRYDALVRRIPASRPGIIIDPQLVEAYLKGCRKPVRMTRHAWDKAYKLDINSLSPLAGIALELIDNEYPRLASRTLRVKYAIALVAAYACEGRDYSIRELSKILGVNERYLRRLVYKLRRKKILHEIVYKLRARLENDGEVR